MTVTSSSLKVSISAVFLGLTVTCVAISAYVTFGSQKGTKKRLLASFGAFLGTPVPSDHAKAKQPKEIDASAATVDNLEDHQGSGSDSPGLLISDDLFAAIKECKEKVARISKACREHNRKFRDIEFDLENDEDFCLYSLDKSQNFCPADVRRVSELYDRPQFFMGQAGTIDIIQGAVGDCWFLSALSSLSTIPGLVSKVCVARDEEVGVYAFIFRRNGIWVPIVIDDQLFSSIPKYDSLSTREQLIYKKDREAYDAIARKGGDGLYFARSGREGETWVPLIEKAFAKLYGDYEAINGGLTADALEDLTGGVSESWKIQDILNVDVFWNEELSLAGKDRCFDVHFPSLSCDDSIVTVEGLFGGHAYTVVKAREVRGKRFVVVRNPWEEREWKWTGRWSDGSKEWTPETWFILKELGHQLGDCGSFVMEYCDFMDCWHRIQRTRLLDSSWRMSQYWLSIPPKPDGYPTSFGEAIFYFTLSKASDVYVVLAQLDDRFFEDISSRALFVLDFVVCKRGEKEWRGSSSRGLTWSRTVSCDFKWLDEGEYAVYPRVVREFCTSRDMCWFKESSEEKWDQRKLSRTLTQRAQSLALAQNIDFGPHEKHIPRPALGKSPIATSPTLSNTSSDSEAVGQGGSITGTVPSNVSGVGGKIEDANVVGSTTEEIGEQEEPPPLHITLDKLCKDPEDRSLLVLGLRVYARTNCLGEVTGRIPPEALIDYPVAEV